MREYKSLVKHQSKQIRSLYPLSFARSRRLLESFVLLTGMTSIVVLMGWMLGGVTGIVALAILLVVHWLRGGNINPFEGIETSLIPIDQRNAPGLIWAVTELSRRAGLKTLPRVYLSQNNTVNAYTAGTQKMPILVVSRQLLSMLNEREILGVLAHEVAHIQNNDVKYLHLMMGMHRLAHSASIFGMLLIILNIPLILTNQVYIAWSAILILVALPWLALILFFAFSRVREYQADLGAVQLTGDPEGLASALSKIETFSFGLLRWLKLKRSEVKNHYLLNTHPPVKDRIRKLSFLVDPSLPR